MVLVAGPYRSGTGDDPVKIAANVHAMEVAALAPWQAGHLPVLGEWFALPLIASAGSRARGDAVWDGIFHPVAEKVAARCDGCLRIGGASAGAELIVSLFTATNRPVWLSVEAVPAPPAGKLQTATAPG